jgi:transcriptional regulator with XRE-family HTH domain
MSRRNSTAGRGEPSVGRTLKRLRIKGDFTQGEVSRAAGYGSPQFISNIERGLAPLPADKIGRLGRMLGRGSAEKLARAKVRDFKAGVMRALKTKTA